MYTLAGVVDHANGWGVGGDSANMLDLMSRYGEETWFRLGDRDLATHLLRTQWLKEGCTLTEITRRLSARLGIQHAILPMTDAEVATVVDTVEHGELDFQTYFVKMRWQPAVRALRFAGADSARMSHDMENALRSADVILIGPSNPWLSIDPILAVPRLRALLKSREVPRVAVCPIVQGEAIKGPTAKLMAELGYEQSAKAVVDYYGDVINGFVYDKLDADVEIDHLWATTRSTVMKTEADRVRLAQEILEWIGA